MSKVMEFDPNGGLTAFMTMMKKKIVMPASLMDVGTQHNHYNSYASITQKIGVYTSLDYAHIIDHLVKFWHIDKLQELNDHGKRAQDYLAGLAERYYRLAERLQEPEEVQLVWLKH
jgi:acyl-[acyl-carrier-protein] desaturase